MSQNYFGSNPRRFTYSICLITDHIYNTFYHKITDNSIGIWISYIGAFRHTIRRTLTTDYLVEYLPTRNIHNDDDRVFILIFHLSHFVFLVLSMIQASVRRHLIMQFEEEWDFMVIYKGHFILDTLVIMG